MFLRTNRVALGYPRLGVPLRASRVPTEILRQQAVPRQIQKVSRSPLPCEFIGAFAQRF